MERLAKRLRGALGRSRAGGSQAAGTPLELPNRLKRGGSKDETSAELGRECLEIVARAFGSDLNWFAGKSILDIGCGNKQAEAIAKYAIPVEHYVGLDNAEELIATLAAQAEGTNLEFHHIPAFHEVYLKDGETLSPDGRLPGVEGTFDLIHSWSLFSHLNASDTGAYFHMARRHAKPETAYFFTAFIDEEGTWYDSEPDRPMLRVRYGAEYLDRLLRDAGWTVERAYLRDSSMRTPWPAVPIERINHRGGGQSMLVARPA